jgi:F-type H+-transporting ATPase subunit b
MAQTTHAGTEVPAEAHAKGGFPPFESQTFGSQLIWFALAFGALYLLMSRVALPRVASILAERHDRVTSDLDKAAKLKSETDQAIATYEKALADARANAQKIAAETHEKLAAETESKRKALESDLAAKLGAAEAQIVSGKTAAMQNVRGIAVDATAAIVERLLGQAPSRDEVEGAIAKTLV